jgi:hypothetical protein
VAGIGAAWRLGAKLASFIGMTEVLFAILFAWLALGQLPTPIQFVGGAFILAGIALVRAGERTDPVREDDPVTRPNGQPDRAGTVRTNLTVPPGPG